MEKSCRKYAPKASPRPLFYFGKQPKTAIAARNSFKNKIFWKGIIKNLWKVNFIFFFSNPVPFNRKSYIKNKKGLELVTSRSSGYETRHKNLFISYQISYQLLVIKLLSDQVWWCNVKQFLSYSKNYTCKFMQINSRHHKLFHFHLLFWI